MLYVMFLAYAVAVCLAVWFYIHWQQAEAQANYWMKEALENEKLLGRIRRNRIRDFKAQVISTEEKLLNV